MPHVLAHPNMTTVFRVAGKFHQKQIKLQLQFLRAVTERSK